MELHFKRLQVWGFKSFVHTAVWDIDGPPGLYFITGINESEPDLGGNGVGKSTLFEALYWCLFGKTSEGLRASNIVTWHKNEAHVAVWLDIDGVEYKISRNQSPNYIRINDKNVEQAELSALIKLTPELALSTLLIGQFSDTFIELANTRRLEIFSDLLNMSRWEKYSRQAASAKSNVAEDLEFLGRHIATEQGRIEEINLDKVKSLYENWEKDKAARTQVLVGQKAGISAELGDVRAEAATIRDDVTDLEKQLAAIVTPDVAQYETMQRTCSELDSRLTELATDRKNIVARMNAMESLGPECPRCEQQVGPEHKAAHIAEYQSMLATLEAEYGSANTKRAKLRLQMDSWLQERRKVQTRIDGLTAFLRTAKDKQSVLLSEVRVKESQLMTVTKQLKATKDETNSFDALYQEAKTKQAQSTIRLAKLHKDRIDLESLRDSIDYWIGGFKKVRLMLLQSALAALEVHVNDGLPQLGMNNWQILLEAERELNNGDLRREFVINVRSPRNPDLVPWEAWSGGERQRLRMAFLFGLSAMLSDHCGIRTNIMMLDEPTTWLSESGISDMLTFLKDKAEREGLQIWLADHRTLEFGGFSGTLVVRKTPKQGSTLEKKE